MPPPPVGIAGPFFSGFSAICRPGVWIALRTILIPKRWSSLSAFSLDRISEARARATPPPGTMPSSTRGSRVQAVVDAILARFHFHFRRSVGAVSKVGDL
jgi:hypothetical protein